MSSDFGLRGPKTPWVCPSDRQLALRAKLRSGWSVKTNQFNTYPKPQPLTDKEQQTIVSVIKRAEELDLYEQRRVGKLVDRLETLRSRASGNGVSQCILCGDSFGLSVFGKTSSRCSDCEKAVCRKCVVDLSPSTAAVSPPRPSPSLKDGILHLCKLCAENREFIKKSGAWFYKGVPTYILPEKKIHYPNTYENAPASGGGPTYQEKRYISRYISDPKVSTSLSSATNKRSGGIFWSKSLSQRTTTSEVDGDSSSGDESPHGNNSSKWKENFRLRLNSSATTTTTSGLKSASPKTDTSADGNEDEKSLYQISDPTLTEGSSGIFHRSFERFELISDSSAILDNNTISSGSSSSASDGLHSNIHRRSQSPSSTDMGLGNIDISLLFDDSQQALHCSIHRAKDLTPTDRNGLVDSFVILKLIPTSFQGTHLRTKTIPKTLHPLYNETLTFYGVTQNDMARQSLGINVVDDDRFGKDCIGWALVPLHRIRPQQTRSLSLRLEKSINGEELEWGRGRILLSLTFLTDKSSLVVGVVKAADLPALDHCGTSDPFVKVRLLHDAGTGIMSSLPSSRKYKTSVKWKTLNPEFKEEFNFKVSVRDLGHLAIAITVWDKDLGKNNDYIGGLLFSSSSKGERLKHWNDMMRNHNTKHLKWHTLSPAVLPP